MRAIKFRAWDIDNQCFRYDFTYPTDTLLGEDINQMPYNTLVMQYTGIRDKNEVEIYEGDIVREPNGRFPIISEIVYYPPSFRQIGKTTNRVVECLNCRTFRLEVIGNIYQTPELLK